MFTQRYGKIQARAISALKPKSKLRGHLEQGRLVDVMLTQIDRQGKLAQIITLKNYASSDPIRFTALTAILELTDLMSQPTPDIDLWRSVQSALSGVRDISSLDQLINTLSAGMMGILKSGGIGMESASNLGQIHAHIQWNLGKKINSLSKIGALELKQTIS